MGSASSQRTASARMMATTSSPLNADERMLISHLLNDEPALDVAVIWAKRLRKLLRRRIVETLDEVLAAATGTLFARFAASLRRDFDAINAALVQPGSPVP